MRIAIAIAIVACAMGAACGSKRSDGAGAGSADKPVMPPQITAIEKRVGKEFHGVVITADAIFVDRVRYAADDHSDRGLLDALAARKTSGDTQVIVIPDPPASTVSAALRMIAMAGWKEVELSTVDADNLRMLCRDQWVTPNQPPQMNSEAVKLSIYLQRDKAWVGLSRINEYQVIDDRAAALDGEKLETTLKEHKQSAFFADRVDAELAADPEVPSSRLLTALELACKVGFTNLVTLQPGELAAIPQL